MGVCSWWVFIAVRVHIHCACVCVCVCVQVGVEYAVVQDAGCFLINKQIRRSPDFAELLQVRQ
jgi:hypothetical protein